MTKHSRFSGSRRAVPSPPRAGYLVVIWTFGKSLEPGPWVPGARLRQGKDWVSHILCQWTLLFGKGRYGLSAIVGKGYGARPKMGLSHWASASRLSGRVHECQNGLGRYGLKSLCCRQKSGVAGFQSWASAS
ncbi:unnamed protein product [Prunus armeniaca]|uniref:Uncharacterized protein n=1 Tax=Prunus armeniaca TaxID=36596 RepID=A0A6J5Y1T6_PRUAR|nr:unnamed protein product [Prunus armeniaca]